MNYKRNFFLFLFFLNLYPCFSNQNFSLDFIPNTGYKYETLEEYFFSSLRPQEKVSQLTWKLNPLWIIGLDTIITYKKLGFSAAINTVIPTNSGIMEDSDWDILNAIKYIYSESEIKTKANICINAETDYHLISLKHVSFYPLLNFQYNYHSLNARNGYGWYGGETKDHGVIPWNDPRAKYYPSGTLNGIDFTRHSIQLFTGIKTEIHIKKVETSFSAYLSPYSYFYTMDTHLGNKYSSHFEQVQHSLLNRIKFKLEIAYKISEKLSPIISGTYNTGSLIKGNLYTENPDSPNRDIGLSPQKSGSTQDELSLQAGLKINF